MIKKLNFSKSILLLFFLPISGNILAQNCAMSINYSVSANGAVTFSAVPSGTNISGTYTWFYGDGSYSFGINQMTASTTYTSNGTFNVAMTFSNSANTCTTIASQTVLINNVNCGLNSSFTYSPSTLNTIDFTSTCTGTTAVAGYTWDYGDGGTGSGPNSSHTYSAGGSYFAVLIIEDISLGSCTSSVGVGLYVCSQTNNFTFTNYGNGVVGFTSIATPTTSLSNYYWDFGDGVWLFGSAALTHTYLTNGIFTVTSTYSSSPNCSSTVQNTINIQNVVSPCGLNANFTYTILNNVVTFSTTSTLTSPSATYSWDFGDNTSSTGASPTHTYAQNQGSYNVILTVNNNYTYTCLDSYSSTIPIFTCTFTPTYTLSYGANGSVSFSTSASGSNTYSASWVFGDSYGSNAISPTHTYSNNGVYTATLNTMANLPSGGICTYSYTSIIVTVTSACVADANFSVIPTGTAQVWNVIPTSPNNVTSALWSWGDGSTSNTLYTSHTYSAAGNYSICLSVTVTCGTANSYCNSYMIYKSSEDQSVIQVTVIEPTSVGINHPSADNIAFMVSPNPNNGSFRLLLDGLNNSNVNLTIYNLVGQQVYSNELETSTNQLTKDLELNHLSNGVYFIKVETGKEALTKKIVIDRN